MLRWGKFLDRILNGCALLVLLLNFTQAGKPTASLYIAAFHGTMHVLIAIFFLYFLFQLIQFPRHLEKIQVRMLDLAILLPFLITVGDPNITVFFILFRQILVNLYRLTLLVNLKQLYEKTHPLQILSIGFLAITLIGTILLTLPISSSQGIPNSLIDALFTATSALTTTGLAVVDTGSFYSLFGQIIILVLVQIGGLGYMIFIALMILGLGGKLSLGSKMLLHQSIGHPSTLDMIKFSKMVIKFTLFFEILGAVSLTLCFAHSSPLEHAVYLGIFHSISAFCTAGFSTFSDSFITYQSNLTINLILMFLGIVGGLGFFVIYDIYSLFNQKLRDPDSLRILSVHSKFVLYLSLVMMGLGALIIFLMEIGVPLTPLGKTLLTSTFQAVSASTTTGFNSIDIAAMLPTSLFILIILMLIGASPGGTGGGIKTSTFGTILFFLFATLKGKRGVNIFTRQVPISTVMNAFAIGFISVLWLTFSVLVLTATESGAFMEIVFEAASAFGTVGLSMGLTPELSIAGKLFISITMLIGRIGPLALGFSLVGKPKAAGFHYAEADVLVG